jgi:hypothetical protein
VGFQNNLHEAVDYYETKSHNDNQSNVLAGIQEKSMLEVVE